MKMWFEVLKSVWMNGTKSCQEHWYGKPENNVEDLELGNVLEGHHEK